MMSGYRLPLTAQDTPSQSHRLHSNHSTIPLIQEAKTRKRHRSHWQKSPGHTTETLGATGSRFCVEVPTEPGRSRPLEVTGMAPTRHELPSTPYWLTQTATCGHRHCQILTSNTPCSSGPDRIEGLRMSKSLPMTHRKQGRSCPPPSTEFQSQISRSISGLWT